MTNINELCEVSVNGSTYRNWTGVTIRWDLNDNQALHFTLTTAEIDDKLLKLQPLDRVDIRLAGQELVKQGWITTRQVHLDSDSHAIQLDGTSRAGLMWRASVDKGAAQYQGYAFPAIAKNLLKPIGVGYRSLKLPKGAEEVFKNVVVYRGEPIFNALNRLAQMRNVWIAVDPKTGDIVGGDSQGGTGTALIEGKNMWIGRFFLQVPHAESMSVQGQQQGSDEVSGKRASEVSATAKAANAAKGTNLIVLAEEPISQKEAQTRANKLAREIEASSWRVWVTTQGFMKPGGGLWELREPVSVTSKTLFPSGFETMQGSVYGIVWHQDARSGTTCTVEVVNPRVAGDPNDAKPVFGGANASEATPDNHDERGADQPAL